MAKNIKKLLFSIPTAILGVLGFILFFTTAFIARNTASDNYTRVFFNGDIVTRLGDLVITLNSSSFPDALFILCLIGFILIILGSAYTMTLAVANKDCIISNRKAPGPVTGILFLLGGILGFIGLMIFIPWGMDYFESSSSSTYGLGFIFTLIVMILFLLIGAFLLVLTFMNKDKKRNSKKKKK